MRPDLEVVKKRSFFTNSRSPDQQQQQLLPKWLSHLASLTKKCIIFIFHNYLNLDCHNLQDSLYHRESAQRFVSFLCLKWDRYVRKLNSCRWKPLPFFPQFFFGLSVHFIKSCETKKRHFFVAYFHLLMRQYVFSFL